MAGYQARQQWPNCCANGARAVYYGRDCGQSIGIALQRAMLTQLSAHRGGDQRIRPIHKDADYDEQQHANRDRQCAILLI